MKNASNQPEMKVRFKEEMPAGRAWPLLPVRTPQGGRPLVQPAGFTLCSRLGLEQLITSSDVARHHNPVARSSATSRRARDTEPPIPEAGL